MHLQHPAFSLQVQAGSIPVLKITTRSPCTKHQVMCTSFLMGSFTFTLTVLSEVGAQTLPADKQPDLQRPSARARLTFGACPAMHLQVRGCVTAWHKEA